MNTYRICLLVAAALVFLISACRGRMIEIDSLEKEIFLGENREGVYRNGKRNGEAIEVDKDGKRFEGTYKDDLRDGKYIEKDRDGNIVAQGMYILGNRVQ